MTAEPSQFREAMSRIAIYWTDERFRIDGLSYPRIPMLVDRRTMRHLLVPTEWLVDLAVVDGRAQSPLTWRTYAYGLRDFLAFADDHEWDWSAPTEAMIATYSNHLAQSGRKRNTVNRAVTIICKFYEWAHARKFIRTLDLRYEAVRMTQHGFLAHIVDETKLSARAVVIPRRRRNERLPRFFTKAEQERIIEALSPRDQLIALWAVNTGAREHEICALRVAQLPSDASYASRRRARVPLTKTKGNAPGDLWVPSWLIDRTFQHVSFFGRRRVMRASEQRGKPIPDNIFLGRWGTPLKPDSVYNNFKAAIRALGMDGTFHDLRHTFAITTLDALMRRAASADGPKDGRNPLLTLQKLMRHASIQTTMKYLTAREFYLTEIDSEHWELPDEE
jgi:integrase